MMISVAFALAVATSAEATSSAPLHEPDAMITQVRKARWVAWPRAKCWDPNQRAINGVCGLDAPLPAQPSTCVLHGGTAFALSTMGRSRATGAGVDHPQKGRAPNVAPVPEQRLGLSRA